MYVLDRGLKNQIENKTFIHFNISFSFKPKRISFKKLWTTCKTWDPNL